MHRPPLVAGICIALLWLQAYAWPSLQIPCRGLLPCALMMRSISVRSVCGTDQRRRAELRAMRQREAIMCGEHSELGLELSRLKEQFARELSVLREEKKVTVTLGEESGRCPPTHPHRPPHRPPHPHPHPHPNP